MAAYLRRRLGQRAALALAHRAVAYTGRATPQLLELIALLVAPAGEGTL
jgi:hypothetical protein